MQTSLADFVKGTPQGQEADRILRTCVHCGFCLATCPTYQLLGDELDSPRGRIYLIKQFLEGQDVSAKTQLHLDRCLTCCSCETTCPSGVQYHRLVDIGRDLVDRRVSRPLFDRLIRRGLRAVLPFRGRFTPLLRLGQAVRGLLPRALKATVPPRRQAGSWPQARHQRRMLVLDGCVQPGIAPDINPATARVLDRLGISVIAAPGAGCCGAVSYHLDARSEGLDFMRRLIDTWWPYLEEGVEAIIMTASGCGAMVKEYGHLLKDDPAYAQKAAKVSNLTKDLVEVLVGEELAALSAKTNRRIAFHAPCTLQHGQQLDGAVEGLLSTLGFSLAAVPDAHLCCGSAGTYSILQKKLSERLLQNKLAALGFGEPELIATANIGCLAHLQSGSERPVQHWIEVVDQACR